MGTGRRVTPRSVGIVAGRVRFNEADAHAGEPETDITGKGAADQADLGVLLADWGCGM